MRVSCVNRLAPYSARVTLRGEKAAEKQAKKIGITFEEVACKWVGGNIRWAEAHAAKVLRSLEQHVFPLIGSIHVTDLKTADMLIPRRVAERKDNPESATAHHGNHALNGAGEPDRQ